MDFEKQELEMKAQQYLDAMQGGVKTVGKDVKELGTSTLIIGGAFLVAFLLGRKFIKNKKAKPFNDPCLDQHGVQQMVVQNQKSESPIVRMIKEHITIFLIAIIKEKLMTYLSETEKKHESLYKSS